MKFATPEQALRWAYETQASGSFASTGRAVSSVPSKDSFTVRIMQAQSILFMCEKDLSILHAAYVKVQFGREGCTLGILTEHIRNAEPVKGINRRSIEVIIRSYCGDRIGMREIRRSLNCGMLKASMTRNIIFDLLDAVHSNAMDKVRTLLAEKGLLLKIIT